MSSYKFYYFGVRGRGEPVRLLFHLANEKFEDERITMEGWRIFKPDMPLGQIPVLEVDGVKIGQTTAILRYLGNKFHRAGSNAIESARLDMIAEVVQEFLNAPGMALYPKIVREIIPGDKEKHFKEHVVNDIEKFAPTIERFLVENGNNGLFIGDCETWVDVFAAETFSKLIDYGSPDALDAYPHILSLINRIFNHPNIKSYMAQRPVTIY